MTEPFVVTNPAAADFLVSPDTRYLLGPFMHGERSMSEAASMLGGLGLNTLHRRVKQMLELGLLEHTRSETRGGHRVKLYRATHGEFVVPFGQTSSVDLESLFIGGFSGSAAILGRGVARAMTATSADWGFRVFWQGGVLQQAVALGGRLEPVEGVRSWYSDTNVRLTPEAAQAFSRELQKLYENLWRQAGEEGDPYFFFAGFAPTE